MEADCTRGRLAAKQGPLDVNYCDLSALSEASSAEPPGRRMRRRGSPRSIHRGLTLVLPAWQLNAPEGKPGRSVVTFMYARGTV